MHLRLQLLLGAWGLTRKRAPAAAWVAWLLCSGSPWPSQRRGHLHGVLLGPAHGSDACRRWCSATAAQLERGQVAGNVEVGLQSCLRSCHREGTACMKCHGKLRRGVAAKICSAASQYTRPALFGRS